MNSSESPSTLLIPDLHGHWGRFQAAMAGAKRYPKARLVFLGDLIDDSPRRRTARKDYREKGVADDSRVILEEVRKLHEAGRADVLLGNHEVMAMSAVLDGHPQFLDLWWKHGGRETAASYDYRVNDTSGPLIDDLLWLREHARLWRPVGPPDAQLLASHATRPNPLRFESGLDQPKHLLSADDFDPVVWFPLGEESESESSFLYPLPAGFVASTHGHMEQSKTRELLDVQRLPAIQLDLHPSQKKLALLYVGSDGKRTLFTQPVS